ncbi:MAG: hypothetical protein GY835_22065, partial [bacterium]|nr:hypothetical protein [bacterium]
RMREIEWAMTVPPTSPRPLQGIAALEAWDEAGELGDELLALADPAAAKDSQYWTALVVHQLLDREREQRFVAPRRGLELAIIGVRVAEETMRRKGNNWRRYRGLVALAQATKANALRILGEAREAARILELAEPFIHGEKDLVVQWEYLSLVGATQSYLRRMGEARQSLDRAIAISRAMNDRHRTARALANRSYLDFAAGVLTSKSLSGLERAAELADPAREPRFRALVYVNLARYQADLGLIAEAEATWRRIPRFQERVLELKRQGVLGVIHLCAERWQSARSVLSATADQLAEIGSADSAYYQLLLVITLLGEGRLSEANRLGLETAALFAGAGIGSIALTAMEVAEEANRGEVSVRAIKQLVMAIEAAPGAVPGAANRSNWSTERIDLGAVPHE